MVGTLPLCYFCINRAGIFTLPTPSMAQGKTPVDRQWVHGPNIYNGIFPFRQLAVVADDSALDPLALRHHPSAALPFRRG